MQQSRSVRTTVEAHVNLGSIYPQKTRTGHRTHHALEKVLEGADHGNNHRVGWWVDDVQRIANPNLRCLLHHPTRVTTRKNLGMANFKVDALDVILAVATRDVDASNFQWSSRKWFWSSCPTLSTSFPPIFLKFSTSFPFKAPTARKACPKSSTSLFLRELYVAWSVLGHLLQVLIALFEVIFWKGWLLKFSAICTTIEQAAAPVVRALDVARCPALKVRLVAEGSDEVWIDHTRFRIWVGARIIVHISRCLHTRVRDVSCNVATAFFSLLNGAPVMNPAPKPLQRFIMFPSFSTWGRTFMNFLPEGTGWKKIVKLKDSTVSCGFCIANSQALKCLLTLPRCSMKASPICSKVHMVLSVRLPLRVSTRKRLVTTFTFSAVPAARGRAWPQGHLGRGLHGAERTCKGWWVSTHTTLYFLGLQSRQFFQLHPNNRGWDKLPIEAHGKLVMVARVCHWLCWMNFRWQVVSLAPILKWFLRSSPSELRRLLLCQHRHSQRTGLPAKSRSPCLDCEGIC